MGAAGNGKVRAYRMIINEFKMRHDIAHYNLSGMGCSAGLIAIELASKLLQIHSNQYALVVSTENITQNWYFGSNRSMLLPNCLFRVGCSAVVLTNRRMEYWRAKYHLYCPIIRTMTGGKNDAAYHCIYQMEDENGQKVRCSFAATWLSLSCFQYWWRATWKLLTFASSFKLCWRLVPFDHTCTLKVSV
jgi:predicted naringenin-chalcone synthase